MSGDVPRRLTDPAGGITTRAGDGDAGADRLPTVLVTRPQPQADEWVAALQALGLRAQALPLLGIAAPADLGPVHAAWRHLGQQAVVMFVSPSAVQQFFAVCPVGLAWPPRLIAAGTGPGTRQALLTAGVPAGLVLTPPDSAATFDSEALWAVLRPRLNWTGLDVLVVRGEGGRDWLADTLRQHGALVHFVEAYRRTAPVLDAAAQRLLQQALALPDDYCWLFSSSEAVGHLPTLAPGADWRPAVALASHPRIAQTAERLGFGRVQQVAPAPGSVAAALRSGLSAH